MQLYMTATPQQYSLLSGTGFRLSHLVYQIGQDQHLHRSSVSRQTQIGLLALHSTNLPAITEPNTLCREILRECANRGFEGVAADFGGHISPDRMSFFNELAGQLQRNKKKLFVSASYGKQIPSAHVLINTALSGGTLSTMLIDACNVFGKQRIALDIERVRMDFLLPSPSGEGTLLSQAQLESLISELKPAVYFSHELCAKYFTYQKDRHSHFVLFDDADTIRCKIKLGQQLDIPCAFLLCSEVSDLLNELKRH